MNTAIKEKNNQTILTSLSKGKLIISPELEKQIDTFHAFVGHSEWSGILFYTIQGDVNKAETIVIEAKGMYPMDIGTAAYTEYEHGAETMGAFERFPEAIESQWTVGQIHTHHNMQTFFSGTDLQELRDSTPNHAFFLSLIVNIDKQYSAKLCVEGEKEIEQNYQISYKGVIKDIFKTKPQKEKKIEKIIYAIDLDIEIPFDADFDRIVQIKKKNEDKQKALKESYTWRNSNSGNQLSMFDDGFFGKTDVKFNSRTGNPIVNRFIKPVTKSNPVLKSKSEKKNSQLENFLSSLISLDFVNEPQVLENVLVNIDSSFIKLDAYEKELYFESITDNLETGVIEYWGESSQPDDLISHVCAQSIQILSKYPESEFINELKEELEMFIFTENE